MKATFKSGFSVVTKVHVVEPDTEVPNVAAPEPYSWKTSTVRMVLHHRCLTGHHVRAIAIISS